jgi:hypothetical protein
MQTTIVVGAFVIVTAAVFVVLGRSLTRIGVESHIVTGQDGQTREARSFNAWRSNTLAGRTIGSAYIAICSARFDRQERAASRNQ